KQAYSKARSFNVVATNLYVAVNTLGYYDSPVHFNHLVVLNFGIHVFEINARVCVIKPHTACIIAIARLLKQLPRSRRMNAEACLRIILLIYVAESSVLDDKIGILCDDSITKELEMVLIYTK